MLKDTDDLPSSEDREGAIDPALYDPPKPIVRVEDPAEIAAKIEKLSQGLAAVEKSPAERGAGRAPVPGLITSASLDEARTYVNGIRPAADDDIITQEMRRVCIADEVNSVTWVTERIDRSALKSAAATKEGRGERISGADGSLPARTSRDHFDSLEAPRSAQRARILRVTCAALAVSLVAFGLGYFQLVGRTAEARPALAVRALALAPEMGDALMSTAAPPRRAAEPPVNRAPVDRRITSEVNTSPTTAGAAKAMGREFTASWSPRRTVAQPTPSTQPAASAPPAAPTSSSAAEAPSKNPEIARRHPK